MVHLWPAEAVLAILAKSQGPKGTTHLALLCEAYVRQEHP